MRSRGEADKPTRASVTSRCAGPTRTGGVPRPSPWRPWRRHPPEGYHERNHRHSACNREKHHASRSPMPGPNGPGGRHAAGRDTVRRRAGTPVRRRLTRRRLTRRHLARRRHSDTRHRPVVGAGVVPGPDRPQVGGQSPDLARRRRDRIFGGHGGLGGQPVRSGNLVGDGRRRTLPAHPHRTG